MLFLGHVRRELLARVGARQYFFFIGAQSLLDHRADVGQKHSCNFGRGNAL